MSGRYLFRQVSRYICSGTCCIGLRGAENRPAAVPELQHADFHDLVEVGNPLKYLLNAVHF
jgi:hypothetical protein